MAWRAERGAGRRRSPAVARAPAATAARTARRGQNNAAIRRDSAGAACSAAAHSGAISAAHRHKAGTSCGARRRSRPCPARRCAACDNCLSRISVCYAMRAWSVLRSFGSRLLLPARGEKVGMRGPLRWAENHGSVCNTAASARTAQNRGEAPSPSPRSSRGSTSPRTRGEVDKASPFPRAHARASVVEQRCHVRSSPPGLTRWSMRKCSDKQLRAESLNQLRRRMDSPDQVRAMTNK